GDADALLVHDKGGELKFVAAGDGLDRRESLPRKETYGERVDRGVRRCRCRSISHATPFRGLASSSGLQRLGFPASVPCAGRCGRGGGRVAADDFTSSSV